MRALTHPKTHRERGAAALIVALSVVVMCGAAAISVDYGRLSHDKRKVQIAADAAARAIALDCAKKLPCTQAAAQATAAQFGLANGGTDTQVSPVVLDVTNRKVRVTIGRSVTYAFAQALPNGPSSGAVRATAEASWGSVPVSGRPVLPFAVPLCSVQQNRPTSSQINGIDHTYRTDLLNQVTQIAGFVSARQAELNGVLNGLAGVVGGVLNLLGIQVRSLLDTALNPLLGSASTNNCSPQPDLVTAQGGIWLTGLQGAVAGTYGGLFPDSGAPCQLRSISTENLVAPMVAGLRSSECYNLLGTTIKKGDTVLLPVYVPGSGANTSGLLDSSLNIDAGVHLLGSNAVQLNVNIVGFVPFTITEWDNGRAAPNKNETPYFSTRCDDTLDLGTRVLNSLTAPATGTITKALDLLAQTVTQIDKLPAFNIVTWLLNTVVGLVTTTLNTLLPGLGDKVKELHLTSDRDTTKNLISRLKAIITGVQTDIDNVTLGCQAIRGHFTRATEVDPRFTWDTAPSTYPSELLDLFTTVKIVK